MTDKRVREKRKNTSPLGVGTTTTKKFNQLIRNLCVVNANLMLCLHRYGIAHHIIKSIYFHLVYGLICILIMDQSILFFCILIRINLIIHSGLICFFSIDLKPDFKKKLTIIKLDDDLN